MADTAAISAILTGGLTVLTAVYVVLTWRLVRHQARARRPQVVVDLELPGALMLGLSIQNVGLTPARDIRFSVEQDVGWFTNLKEQQTGLRSLRIIRSGIGYLPPGRPLRFYAGRVKADHIGGVLKLRVEYRNDEGSPFADDIVIDTEIYQSVRFDTYRSATDEISSAIRQLGPDIKSLKRHDVRAALTTLGVCRFCGETIVATARKCPHCLEWLRAKPAPHRRVPVRAASPPPKRVGSRRPMGPSTRQR